MNEDPTKELPQRRSFEEQVLAEFAALRSEVAALRSDVAALQRRCRDSYSTVGHG